MEVIDAPVSQKQLGCCVPLPEQFLREGHALLATLGSSELQVLTCREITGMRRDDVEEAGFVLGVAKAAEVFNTGFGKCHGSKAQNRGCDFVFIAHSAKTCRVLGARVELKASAGLFRDVTSMVVPCGEFQIKTLNFVFLRGVLDTQVWKTD